MIGASKRKPWEGRQLHFVGIGGAGMSGLAAVCHGLGATVSGSDRELSSYADRLVGAGIEVVVGHRASNVPEEAELVISTAIDDSNPELVLACERGLRVLRRGELLADLCAEKRLIAVAGAHGKTTTTAMIAWALNALGADPAFFIGGELPFPDGAVNSGWGAGEWVVAEADESDGSFLDLDPEIAVVTGIELDHHDHWGTEQKLRKAFHAFTEGAQSVVTGPGVSIPGALGFAADHPGPTSVGLAVPGWHNRLNARAAVAALSKAGFEPSQVADALVDFPGVKRRLEFKGWIDGARVFDDYAHHPTEVEAALDALAELDHRRLVAIFQPHLYSRTKALCDRFGSALSKADVVGVLDVYAAREQPTGELAGVSGLDVARAAADRSGGKPVWWLKDLESARLALIGELRPGDLVATLGAGDVTCLSDRLVE